MFLFFLKIESGSIIIENWWKLLIIGIVCTGIAFLLFMDGIRKVKAQKIFIVTALEPLAGTLFALILLKEMPSLMTISGAILILFGVYWITRQN